MSNEIKVGDKVRVREDAPRMFRSGFNHVYTAYISKVLEVDDGNAIIEMTMANMQCQERIIVPTKYLVKVEDEAKEAKYKVGDKVVRKNVSTVRTIISIDYVGDDEDHAYYYKTVDSQGNNPMEFVESELILYTEPTEEKSNHTISIPVNVYLDDTYWSAYAADLAKEIAVKVANKYSDPKEAGEYAVLVAKAVVEGLKKK